MIIAVNTVAENIIPVMNHSILFLLAKACSRKPFIEVRKAPKETVWQQTSVPSIISSQTIQIDQF